MLAFRHALSRFYVLAFRHGLALTWHVFQHTAVMDFQHTPCWFSGTGFRFAVLELPAVPALIVLCRNQNILNRFWELLQVANGMAVESGKRDEAGNPTLEAKYGLHSLRHAAASLFIAHLGWTPKRVQTVMGHSSIKMTFDLYGHLFEDREGDQEAMKKLEAAIVAA